VNFGWIKLHRKIKDHWFWPKGTRYTKLEAWIDLLISANHSPEKVSLGLKLIIVGRGQYITSQVALAKRWGWDRKTVNNFLKLTKSDEMLDFKSSKERDTGFTLITIRNYRKYQDREDRALDIETDIQTDIQRTSNGHS